jgi:hypothetical protein
MSTFFFNEDYVPMALSISSKRSKAKSFSQAYQDKFEIVYSDRVCEEMTDAEIVAISGKVLLFDIECYPNYFLILFRSPDNGKIISFQDDGHVAMDLRKLNWVMAHFCIIGYNSKEYDIPMTQLALTGKRCAALYAVSCTIIYENMRSWQIEKKYRLGRPRFDHIDLIEVAPLMGSLKLYAGRLHTERMQDLPVDPTKRLTVDEIAKVFNYCVNDLFSTELLFNELKPGLELRYRMSAAYLTDVRSRSDAQIAEQVISSEIQKITGQKPERPDIPPGTIYLYNVPDYIEYKHPALQAMLEVVRSAYFIVGEDGYVTMPKQIGEIALSIGACVYHMGIGGLHSSEKNTAHRSDSNTMLIDRDVASYYPAIILNQQLYPQHLGPAFLSVYKKIVDDRLAAKASGNKQVAASLKITINGSFGKLGSKWSVLYAPDLMIQVTVTGQLSLLMLIDMIESAGIPVVSGNTDGVIIKCQKEHYDALQEIIALWERRTGFTTEETRYDAVYSRDVNNYIALKLDGTTKPKGCYSERGSAGDSVLSKNPENLVCNDAVAAAISKNTPVEQTIRGCTDIRRFVTIRNVKGGAVKSGIPLGKCIRWYYSTAMLGEINYASNGNKVPNSDRAMPCMQLPKSMPADVDYQRYIDIANDMLVEIGYSDKGSNSGFLFDLDESMQE